MSDLSMTISEQALLEKCRDVELLCQELYLFFAELFAENAPIARLWCKMANEEQNHANQFTMALRLRKVMPYLVKVDLERVELILSQLRAVITKVKINPPKLLDALGSSIRLEKHVADLHLNCVALFEDESHKNLFNAMMASDEDHVDALQEAYDALLGQLEFTASGP